MVLVILGMLMGVLYHEIHESIPTIGFSPSWGLSMLLVLMVRVLQRKDNNVRS